MRGVTHKEMGQTQPDQPVVEVQHNLQGEEQAQYGTWESYQRRCITKKCQPLFGPM